MRTKLLLAQVLFQKPFIPVSAWYQTHPVCITACRVLRLTGPPPLPFSGNKEWCHPELYSYKCLFYIKIPQNGKLFCTQSLGRRKEC